MSEQRRRRVGLSSRRDARCCAAARSRRHPRLELTDDCDRSCPHPTRRVARQGRPRERARTLCRSDALGGHAEVLAAVKVKPTVPGICLHEGKSAGSVSPVTFRVTAAAPKVAHPNVAKVRLGFRCPALPATPLLRPRAAHPVRPVHIIDIYTASGRQPNIHGPQAHPSAAQLQRGAAAGAAGAAHLLTSRPCVV